MSPKYTNEPIMCGHCNTNTLMEIVAKEDRVAEIYDEENKMQYDAGYYYTLMICCHCKKPVLEEGHVHPAQEFDEEKILYPTTDEEKIKGLPTVIKKIYESAVRVKKVDANAYAVLLGRLLEAVFLQMGAKNGSMIDKIKNLSQKNILPENLANIADKFRHFRNVGAHYELGSLSEAEVVILEDITKAVLEYIYKVPAILEKANAAIEKLKKKSGASSGK